MNTLQPPAGFYDRLATIRNDARAIFQVNMQQLSKEEQEKVENSFKSLSIYFDASPQREKIEK
ncbi:MAG: hypothetical protein K2Z81_25085 [Cyanobacteria bacterium]|nr:hypothetical protein [Cyanobacteriota bacterium]